MKILLVFRCDGWKLYVLFEYRLADTNEREIPIYTLDTADVSS